MAVCMRCGVIPDDEVVRDPVFGQTHQGHTLTGEDLDGSIITGLEYTEPAEEPWPAAPATAPEAPDGGPE